MLHPKPHWNVLGGGSPGFFQHGEHGPIDQANWQALALHLENGTPHAPPGTTLHLMAQITIYRGEYSSDVV